MKRGVLCVALLMVAPGVRAQDDLTFEAASIKVQTAPGTPPVTSPDRYHPRLAYRSRRGRRGSVCGHGQTRVDWRVRFDLSFLRPTPARWPNPFRISPR